MNDGNGYREFALFHLIAGNAMAATSEHGPGVVTACARRLGREWRESSAAYYEALWLRRPDEARRIFDSLGGRVYGFCLERNELTLASLASSPLPLPMPVKGQATRR